MNAQETYEHYTGEIPKRFPTITIPDPGAVGKWLDEQLPSDDNHSANFFGTGWRAMHWTGKIWVYGSGDTPESLLADIQAKLAANDPLAKLRKEAEALGYGLLKLPQD